MATKKTPSKAAKKASTKAKPAKKAAKKPTKATKAAKPTKAEREAAAAAAAAKVQARHPAAKLKAQHGSKDDLIKTLVEPLLKNDEDKDALKSRLSRASNKQLLHLKRVVETVQSKFGSRDKLIDAIGKAEKKTKDQDFMATLETFSLPRLLDIAVSAERRAKQA
jgi:hypothetical protein